MSRFQQNSGTASRRSRQVSLTSTISVYSTTAPSMSRASSERVMDTLDTPMDECFPASVSLDPKNLAPGDVYNDTQPTIRKDVPYDRFARDPLVPDGPVLTHIHVPPMELPSPLEYRRSTRELISKYEASSGPCGTPPSKRSANRPLFTPPALPSLQRRNSPLPELPTATKLKTQTPFSFRSLLTVFGKKSKSPRPAQPEACVSVARPVIPQVEDVFLTSSPSRTGPALYLSSSTHPPLWHLCSLTLHPSHLALTFSEDARHITHTIPLLYCVDVISLASHQLGNEFPSPSLNGDKEFDKVAYVFEMTFEGCEPTKERLAAWSVAERGRWVSATWDAILACRDPKTARSDGRVASPNDIIRGPPLKVVNGTSQPSSSASSPSLVASLHHVLSGERKIPSPSPTSSVSVPTTPTRPRRRPPSDPSSAPSSLPSSSSIQTLGSMSIVRARLAKLDAQEHSSSVSKGIANPSRSYVASPVKLRAPRVDKEGRDIHGYPSISPDRFEREGSTISRFNSSGASQETSFTALDAHAMYHDPLHNHMDTETISTSTKRTADDDGARALPGTTEPRRQDRNLLKSGESVDTLKQDLRTLVKSFHEHVAEQSSQASGLADRLASMDGGIDVLVSSMKQDPIEVDLAPLHEKLDEIKTEMAAFNVGTMGSAWGSRNASGFDAMTDISHSGGRLPSNCDLSPVLTKLEELKIALKGDLPLLLQKLVGLEAPSAISVDTAPVLAKLQDIMEVVNSRRDALDASSTPADSEGEYLEDIHAKLEGLVSLLIEASKDPVGSAAEDIVMHNVSPTKHLKETAERPEEHVVTEESNSAMPPRELVADSEQITKLLELLQDEQSSRATQAQQQADSVRYLNELNTWLENFVTSSVGNMRQVATGVDRLSKEWLPVTEVQTEVDSSDPKDIEGKEATNADNTFASLQQFLAEQREKREETHNLQAAMQNLTETVKEDMTKNAEARFEMVRHAQVQETLLNGLAAELTKEIRGERLRFVDAMKDATSVNVAVHVEEFKKVLGRLHHEKMILEQQIAELFSFVAKQKQSHPPQPQHQPQPQPQQPQPQPQCNRVTLEVPRPPPRPLPQIYNHKLPQGYVNSGTVS